MGQSNQPLGIALSEGLGPNAETVARDPTQAWTLAQRCELAEKCLPVSGFRAQVERLHADMLAEIERLTGMDDAMRAEWDRECGDTDKILRALGLDPANCRTDGGSLKLQMVLGALEHWDVMRKREAEQPLRIAIARAVPAMHSYASKNPKHHMNGALQDPCGVYAWLAEFGA